VLEEDTLPAVGAMWTCFTGRVKGVWENMSELKIRIETDEWTYEEYVEA